MRTSVLLEDNNNKGNNRIYRKYRAIQARTKMITHTLTEETIESHGKRRKLELRNLD